MAGGEVLDHYFKSLEALLNDKKPPKLKISKQGKGKKNQSTPSKKGNFADFLTKYGKGI